MTVTDGVRSRGDRLVGTFPSYAAAAQTVELLADRGYPVQTVRVEGREVRMFGSVTGRMSPVRAAIVGALCGMWLGGMVGLVVGFAAHSVVGPLLAGVALGVFAGAALSVAAQLVLRQRGGAAPADPAPSACDLFVPATAYERAVAILGQPVEPPVS